jgi:hypothetical protein
MLASNLRTHTIQEYPPLDHATRSMTLRSPLPVCARSQPRTCPTAYQETCPSSQAHYPSSSAEPQPHELTRPPPHPSGPACLQLHMERLKSHLTGTGTSLVQDSCIHQPARNPAPWVEPALILQASQITTPPGSLSGNH